jgi:hypothetical protein
LSFLSFSFCAFARFKWCRRETLGGGLVSFTLPLFLPAQQTQRTKAQHDHRRRFGDGNGGHIEIVE